MQVFYVIEGALKVKIHDTTLLLATGAIFLVPRGKSLLPPPFLSHSLLLTNQETHIS
jgi:mannose-6-phosphate isomerase-like protein (cupin superfamily)